jgi:predicted outer membrane protein
MPQKTKFTSPKIADKMARVFGNEAKKIAVDMKYRKEVDEFVRKIEQAHKDASKSQQVYK